MLTDHLIFIVEDDEPLNIMLCKFVEKQGFQKVRGFFTAEDMLKEIPREEQVIIIQDFDLPGMNGLEAIRKVKADYSNSEFIFLSGQRSIDVAIEAMKNGAFDYIVKDNFAKENVVAKIKNLIKVRQLYNQRNHFRKLLIISVILLAISWIVLFGLFVYK
jgi:DNA-binding NtrC family response regulator